MLLRTHLLRKLYSCIKLYSIGSLFSGISLLGVVAYSGLDLGALNFPLYLKNIPLIDSDNMLVGVKRVEIDGVPSLYNASIVTYEGHYLLFYRVDQPTNPPFMTHIHYAELDREFNQITEDKVLNTRSCFSEDPRALWIGDELWVIYNDTYQNKAGRRTMHAARVNTQTFEVENIVNLDVGTRIEKNWVPFEGRVAANKEPQLLLEYHIAPQTILWLQDRNEGALAYLQQPEIDEEKISLLWPKTWGPMRGGTPAIKISPNEYLSFFHSSFADAANTRWYIIGAYTFETKPPYAVTSISSHPILFEGIYDTYTPRSDLQVLFPAGFVISNELGREVIHLSCGENDMGVKILSLDKNALLRSLRPTFDLGRRRFHRLFRPPE